MTPESASSPRAPHHPRFSPLLASFGYAFQGIAWAARTQRNWRIHVVAAALAIVLAFALRVSPVEFAVLALTIALVLALETMNSALEATIDALAQPPSEPARHAKDAAAGSVLIAALLSLVVAVAIFGPRLLNLH